MCRRDFGLGGQVGIVLLVARYQTTKWCDNEISVLCVSFTDGQPSDVSNGVINVFERDDWPQVCVKRNQF